MSYTFVKEICKAVHSSGADVEETGTIESIKMHCIKNDGANNTNIYQKKTTNENSRTKEKAISFSIKFVCFIITAMAVDIQNIHSSLIQSFLPILIRAFFVYAFQGGQLPPLIINFRQNRQRFIQIDNESKLDLL